MGFEQQPDLHGALGPRPGVEVYSPPVRRAYIRLDMGGPEIDRVARAELDRRRRRGLSVPRRRRNVP